MILLDPSFNPDGRARFVSWIDRFAGATPTADAQDIEHSEAWPGGRGNHYWFDLNRDWLPLVHPRVAARVRLSTTGGPNLLLDWHEQGSEATYFFQPGVACARQPEHALGEPGPHAAHRRLPRRARSTRIGSPTSPARTTTTSTTAKARPSPTRRAAVGILFEQASSRSPRRRHATRAGA